MTVDAEDNNASGLMTLTQNKEAMPRRAYDCLIVGSSPVCLIEAIWQAEQGKTVAILDSGTRVGGAWQDIELFGCDKVEISTHIMRHYRRGYRFLSKKMGVSLEPMKPEPFWLLPRYRLVPSRTGYARHWNLTLYPTIGKLLTTAGFLDAVRNPRAKVTVPLLSAMVIFWRYLKRGSLRAYYPVGGAPVFIRQLEKCARDAGVSIFLNTDMKGIEVASDRASVTVHTSSGHDFHCRSMAITRQTRIDELISPSGRLAIEKRKNDTHHVHMLVADPVPRRFSFARFRTDSELEMISDISRFSNSFTQKHPNRKLLAAWWRPERLPKEADIKNEFEKLLSEGLLSENAKLEDYNVRTYKATEILESSVQQIRATFKGLIRVLETDNLTENIDHYEKRWTAAS